MTVALIDGEVLPLHKVGKLFRKQLRVKKVAHSDGLFHVLICIDGGDAASCRAELLVGKSLLLKAVKELVIRHTDGGAVADLQVIGCDHDTGVAELLYLIEEVLNIDNHAGAHHVHRAVAENSGGQKVKDELSLLVHDGMTRVVSALITGNYVVLLRKQVDHASLAFVTPVDSDDCC